MDIILILLPLSVAIASVFLVLFVRAVRTGQYDDLDDAAHRLLDDDDPVGGRDPRRPTQAPP